jgi:hypothetical protein
VTARTSSDESTCCFLFRAATRKYRSSKYMFPYKDRLCGLVVRVPGYRSGGPGSIPCTTRKKVVGLERDPLSLVSTTEILERKSSGSCLENREYGRRDPIPKHTTALHYRYGMQMYCTFVLSVNQHFPGLPASGTHCAILPVNAQQQQTLTSILISTVTECIIH